MEAPELDKYLRLGPLKLGRPSEAVVDALTTALPEDGVLPPRWFHRGQLEFQKKYGHLGTILWAKATSSRLLLINGHKVLRVWTTGNKVLKVDLSDSLAALVSSRITFSQVEDIPKGNVRKCAPFTKRINIWQQVHSLELAKLVKEQYGLDNPGLQMRVWT